MDFYLRMGASGLYYTCVLDLELYIIKKHKLRAIGCCALPLVRLLTPGRLTRLHLLDAATSQQLSFESEVRKMGLGKEQIRA